MITILLLDLLGVNTTTIIIKVTTSTSMDCVHLLYLLAFISCLEQTVCGAVIITDSKGLAAAAAADHPLNSCNSLHNPKTPTHDYKC